MLKLLYFLKSLTLTVKGQPRHSSTCSIYFATDKLSTFYDEECSSKVTVIAAWEEKYSTIRVRTGSWVISYRVMRLSVDCFAAKHYFSVEFNPY